MQHVRFGFQSDILAFGSYVARWICYQKLLVRHEILRNIPLVLNLMLDWVPKQHVGFGILSYMWHLRSKATCCIWGPKQYVKLELQGTAVHLLPFSSSLWPFAAEATAADGCLLSVLPVERFYRAGLLVSLIRMNAYFKITLSDNCWSRQDKMLFLSTTNKPTLVKTCITRQGWQVCILSASLCWLLFCFICFVLFCFVFFVWFFFVLFFFWGGGGGGDVWFPSFFYSFNSLAWWT